MSPKTTGRPEERLDVCISRILEHLFNLILGDAVVGTMLDIAIRIVLEIPDYRVKRHLIALPVCCIIIPPDRPRVNRKETREERAHHSKRPRVPVPSLAFDPPRVNRTRGDHHRVS